MKKPDNRKNQTAKPATVAVPTPEAVEPAVTETVAPVEVDVTEPAAEVVPEAVAPIVIDLPALEDTVEVAEPRPTLVETVEEPKIVVDTPTTFVDVVVGDKVVKLSGEPLPDVAPVASGTPFKIEVASLNPTRGQVSLDNKTFLAAVTTTASQVEVHARTIGGGVFGWWESLTPGVKVDSPSLKSTKLTITANVTSVRINAIFF